MSIKLVIGGQYGSEGKGSVVSWMAQKYNFDLAIRTGSPNAGHSFIKPNGEKVIMRQLPCTWAFQETPLYLPSGSIIDLDVLNTELGWLCESKFRSGIYVHPNAAIIEEDALETERAITTGTTGKGVGATRAKECLRTAKLIAQDEFGVFFNDEHHVISDIMNQPSADILIESTQGFGLSMDYKFYPYCTSTNIMPYQILQDADIPFDSHDVEVWMVIRTYPIRIAGNSGYLYKEIDWDILRERHGNHIPTEYTSVTKKVRRVGEFDTELVKDAIRFCNPHKIVLTFVDYLFPNILKTGITPTIRKYLLSLGDIIGRDIDYIGIGTGIILEV
jgi:adenylosuccinate synthase